MKEEVATTGRGRPEFWNESACAYDAYASERGLYRESAAAMVEAARLEPGMSVLDVGCGTGIVIETVLRKFGRVAKVIGVDFSPEMLEVARRRITSSNVEWHCERAENLDRVVRGKVDRIFCNAAFWHFDKEKVARQMSLVLKPGGKCLIGLPAQHFRKVDSANLFKIDRRLWMIMEELNLRGYGRGRSREPEKLRKAAIDKSEVLAFLARNGLELESLHNLSIATTTKDYLDFLRIPIMAKNSFFFDGVPDEEIIEIVNVVSNQSEWMAEFSPPVEWQVYVLVPRARESRSRVHETKFDSIE